MNNSTSGCGVGGGVGANPRALPAEVLERLHQQRLSELSMNQVPHENDLSSYHREMAHFSSLKGSCMESGSISPNETFLQNQLLNYRLNANPTAFMQDSLFSRDPHCLPADPNAAAFYHNLSLAGRNDLSLAGRNDMSLAGRNDLSLARNDLSLAARNDLSLAARNDLSLAGRNDLSLAGRNDLSLAGRNDLVPNHSLYQLPLHMTSQINTLEHERMLQQQDLLRRQIYLEQYAHARNMAQADLLYHNMASSAAMDQYQPPSRPDNFPVQSMFTPPLPKTETSIFSHQANEVKGGQYPPQCQVIKNDINEAAGNSSDSSMNVKSGENSGMSIFACKARNMQLEHNLSTAFFILDPATTEHGTSLTCSYPECRSQGAKFKYCAICKIPAAKQNFLSRHRHDDK